MTDPKTPNLATPCRKYARGEPCLVADHCFNCGRHLDGDSKCAKRCDDVDEESRDEANNPED